VQALVALGDIGLKQAEEMVRENNPWGVVRNGVDILGELGGERAVEHLMDTVQHHKPQVRQESLIALSHIGGDAAALLIRGRLDDSDEKVRATAVRAAATLEGERTVKLLLGRLDQEENKDVLVEILRGLGQLGDPMAVPAIEKRAVGGFLKRQPVEIRIAAYRALAAIRTPHARELVEAATEDKDPEVKSVARLLMKEGREARKAAAAASEPADAEAPEAAATPAAEPARES
jgi:HEAT repeat protein